ncbi:MAG: hypothetical protein Q7K55_05845 [Candidatus Levybacteria bacterium]|nr:hypothetical protein [Candidatus Levybacteria bacterium]
MNRELETEQNLYRDPSKMTRKERLKEIRELGNIVFTGEGYKIYMNSSYKGFDGKTPVQMVKDGNDEAVLRDLAGLYEGGPF